MTVLNDVINASIDSPTLSKYIAAHFSELYDYFYWTTDEELHREKERIQQFLAQKRLVLEKLPANEKNFSFLTFLLDVSERLGLISAFNYLYVFLNSHHFNVGSRLQAAALYLVGVKDVKTLLERYPQIESLLQNSYEFEEDNVDKVLTTIVNMYAKVLLDYGEFNVAAVEALRIELTNSIAKDKYSFLNHWLIYDILATDISDFNTGYTHIHALLDKFLRRGKTKGKELTGFLIEERSDYARDLAIADNNFTSIRRLSVSRHNSNYHGREVFLTLHRGTAVLSNEEQLHGYFYSYGQMHFEKLMSAFEELPDNLFEKSLNVVDWGCGQAMATITLLEYLDEKGISPDIRKIVLIEPSELALRRGALHVSKFISDPNVATINKGLDDLEIQDLEVGAGVNIHLFSNILDIDSISLTRLINLIKTGFGGKNYFVVVSPYINDVKTARIDSFVSAFKEKRNFDLLSSVDNRADEWLNNWTRISRVFVCDLNFT